jgi:D-alanyl-lipoteichoic acid acyltransferase DltB (MBOAT superfamily)
MLFNSFEYIFAFLPISFLLYFYLNSKRLTDAANGFLVSASLFFYAWWNPDYLPLILLSMLFNYVIGNSLARGSRAGSPSRLWLLWFGIVANIALLGYYKYSDFFIASVNQVLGSSYALPNLLLPLAISFFTFQQIAYLVDSYRRETHEYDFLKYALFVTFFPQLIAGPIVHHKEMMPQFARARNKLINYRHIAGGLFIFSLGLFKKVVIADYFATIATPGFDQATSLSFFEAWATSLAYTFQLYFDFSGYTDMAVGAALLFNIRLPINFNSPYKATNIQDFWRRWHITLSRFLRDYIYIPLGGNRLGELHTYRNLMLTFVIGGLWHGAGWTFICWGFLHGLALVVHRVWQRLELRMNTYLAWFLTFNFINVTWVFFRAREWSDVGKILYGMAGGNGIVFSDQLTRKIDFFHELATSHPGRFAPIMFDSTHFVMLAMTLYALLKLRNSQELLTAFKPGYRVFFATCALVIYTLLNMSKVSEFLYFNF